MPLLHVVMTDDQKKVFARDITSSVSARYENLYSLDNTILKDTSQNKDISWKTKTKILSKTKTFKIRTNLRNKDKGRYGSPEVKAKKKTSYHVNVGPLALYHIVNSDLVIEIRS